MWQAPLWLTNSYLENVLKKYLKNDQVKVINVDIQPATANGENYASVMSRIKVQCSADKQHKTTQELSFILKYTYESDPFIAKMMNSYDLYNTEMKMYEEILPKLAEVLKQAGDGDKLFANTLAVNYEKSAILFEDLTVRKYVLADRLLGLNEVHARLVLKKLAKFHAAAAVLNQQLNGGLEKFQRGIFNRHTRAFGCFFEYMTENCAKFAANCAELGAYYQEKLMNLKPHVVGNSIKAYYSNSNKFYTLTHGDLWVNNMMLKYNDDDAAAAADGRLAKDILLIDFQLCSWCSPAVDLHYFFNTSLETKLKLDVHAVDKLVQYYHKILIETFRNLNYKGYVPSLHELQIQLEEGKFLAVIFTIASQALMIYDHCDDADIRRLVDDDERSRKFRASIYENERFQAIIKAILPYFDRHGLLDV